MGNFIELRFDFQLFCCYCLPMQQKTVSINDIAKLSAGINLSRERNPMPESSVYTSKNHEADLVSGYAELPPYDKKDVRKESHILKAGDIIVNLGTRRCAIVSRENENKIIRNSFVKIEVNDSFIYPWFLCYSINESSLFKESIETDVLSVVRPLSVSILGKARLHLPDMDTQKRIGDAYHALCRVRYLNEKRNELLMTAFNKIVNKNVEENK